MKNIIIASIYSVTIIVSHISCKSNGVSTSFQKIDSLNLIINTPCPLERLFNLEKTFYVQFPDANEKVFFYSCPNVYIDSLQKDIDITQLQKAGGIVYNVRGYIGISDENSVQDVLNTHQEILIYRNIEYEEIRINNKTWLIYELTEKSTSEGFTYLNGINYYISIQGFGDNNIQELKTLLESITFSK